VLFDFDFTLADSSDGVVECVRYALGKLGLPCPSTTTILATVGLSLAQTYERLTGRCDPGEVARFRGLFVERADEVMAAGTRIYPSVAPVLAALTAAGCRLGIVSTKFRYRMESILSRDGLREWFAVIVGGEDVGQEKPDPTGLLEALHRLGVAPDRAAYVGDSEVDGETACRAGVDFVGVLTGTTGRGALAVWSPVALAADLSGVPTAVGVA
jgi:phosphoglycolate phosphatase